MFDQSAYNNTVSHIENGRIHQAEQAIKVLIQASPKQARYWYLYSVVSQHLKQPVLAIECAQKALEIDKLPEFSIQLAMAYQQNLNFLAAQQTADKASKMVINSAHQWNSLGNVYSAASNTEKAESMYVKAVEMAPKIHHFLFNLATAYRANGKLAKAEQAYGKLIEIKPDDYEAFYNRSQLSKKNYIPSL